MIGNAAFLLASDVVNRAATLVIYILIARHLGAEQMGQMALALALFYTFQVFAAAGVRTIITREVAKDPDSLNRHVRSGALLVTMGSAVSITALFAFVQVMGYARDTATVVLLMGLGLLPYSLSVVCEAVFQAIERMRYIACAQVPVHIARVGLAYLLLGRGYGVQQVAILLLACQGAIALLEWWMLFRHVARRPSPRLGQSRAAGSPLGMARSAGTFLGIDGLTAINASLNVVLLSALTGERAVGLYGAAIQLMIPVTLVYQSVVVSVFPGLCRRIAGGAGGVTDVLSRMLALLLALGIPAAVGLFFMAESAILFLYRDGDFIHAAPVLRVMAWTLVPAALTSVLGQVFLAGSKERVTLRIVAINLVVGLAGGAVLISMFGLMGAAAAVVLTTVVNLLQHYRSVSTLVPAASLRLAGWKPVVAGLGMAAYLAMARNQQFAVSAVLAGAIYCGILLALMIWTIGGSRRLKAASSRVGPE